MKINRLALVALAAVASLLNVQPLARAAETNAPAPAAGAASGLRERMQETAKELNLTDEQKQKLQDILREKLEKLRGLKDDTSLTREEKMEKVKAVREEITSEVKNILTPDQFDKWKAKQGLLLGGPAAAASGRSAAPVARLQEAIKELNLTDMQKEQLKPLYEEQMGKLRDLRQDGTMSMAEKLQKLQALQQEIGPKLKKVLDAEQYSKWEKDAKQWMEELKKRFAGAQQN